MGIAIAVVRPELQTVPDAQQIRLTGEDLRILGTNHWSHGRIAGRCIRKTPAEPRPRCALDN
jgi:hypothetical protein